MSGAELFGILAAASSNNAETSWPPELALFGFVLLLGTVGAVFTVFWRARKTIRDKPARSKH
jgi:hypothetical protein